METAPKTIGGRKPLRDEVPAGDCLCDYCTAKCCRYFALPIDEPTEPKDFDFIRWYLLHDRATVFVEDDTLVFTCTHQVQTSPVGSPLWHLLYSSANLS